MPAAAKRAGATPVQMFLSRLLRRSVLTGAEQDAILTLPFDAMIVGANRDFVGMGQKTDHACLVSDGLIGRFAQTGAGDRQIIAFHIPGDMVDLQSVVTPHAISPLQALTSATIIRIPHTALRAIATDYPAIAHAFWRDTQVDHGIVCQSLVNLGRRDAASRVAHLLCEMGIRYEQIGQGTQTRYIFPATQNHIADALGLTPIHVNRTLRVLRENGLVTMASKEVTILDWDRLAKRAEFDPSYLQCGQVDLHDPGR
jgi:CRP-like cAMP-binding protein